ncbi:Collagen alpha-3(VI) chain [Holothuria leucospilota]|uniref:Collagen alpha-3(VI) chain n=1 Tax=Holothuria leucospilota TaxID=206669 RepID=A0A9Q1BT47_HOLLE|nr:Collagen alpha-3(VI) chain [Holothuria leucospilota]
MFSYRIILSFLVIISTCCDFTEAQFVDFVCVVGPPVVDTYSSKPVTLHGFVDGSFGDSMGYSITFTSRDDGSILTNGNIAKFGKIGTPKGEKGDKGDMGKISYLPLPGDAGEDGANGASPAPGIQGYRGPPGPRGSQGTDGPTGTPGIDGSDEVYCAGELPTCGSDLHGFQCVQGSKGAKGENGQTGLKGLQGEKGEPPYPSLLGPRGPKGDEGPPGEEGDDGPLGDDRGGAIPGENGINAPQAICGTQSSTKGLPGIQIRIGEPGDIGDPGVPSYGTKGEKGQPGVPATMPGTPGSEGDPGMRGPPGPKGFPGGTDTIHGKDGLFIRPLFQGSQGPSCVSNVPVAVERLSLYEPKVDYMKDMRFGVYFCDFFTRGASFHVPALLYNQDELIPANAKRTFIVSVGDKLSLCVDSKLPKKYVGQLEWVLNGDRTEKLKRWSGSSCIRIKCVETTDAGIYEAFKRPVGRNAKQHAYFIVIVRACPDGKYNPPTCDSNCPSNCENGYCDANTGSCVCLNGFFGSTGCKPNGEGLLGGLNGNIPCLDLGYGRSCDGALVCSEKAGCTCAPGWKGIHCDEPCEPGTYGPDCCLDCPASSPVCNRFTGLPCAT